MIVTLAGENRFLLQAEIDKSVTGFLEKHDELGLERVDAEEASFERLKESLVGMPFLASHKLVIIKGVQNNKQLLEELEHIIAAIPETTDVVLVLSKLDKRAKYYKQLKQLTDFKELSQLDGRDLASWLVNEAKSADARLRLNDAQYLVERVGVNQAILRQELDKLMLYNPEISRDTIDELTEPLPQSTVFELLDAAFAGNKKRLMALYEEQRQLKNEPLAILGMIAWQLHILALVATAKGKSPGDIAKEAKVHPFVIQKTQKIAGKLSYTQIKELIIRALELDIRLKSQPINADDALQHFLLSVG